MDHTVLLWRNLEGLSSAGWNATPGTLLHCSGRCVTHGCSEPRLSVTHAVRTETPVQTSMGHLVKRGPGADHESPEGSDKQKSEGPGASCLGFPFLFPFSMGLPAWRAESCLFEAKVLVNPLRGSCA